MEVSSAIAAPAALVSGQGEGQEGAAGREDRLGALGH